MKRLVLASLALLMASASVFAVHKDPRRVLPPSLLNVQTEEQRAEEQRLQKVTGPIGSTPERAGGTAVVPIPDSDESATSALEAVASEGDRGIEKPKEKPDSANDSLKVPLGALGLGLGVFAVFGLWVDANSDANGSIDRAVESSHVDTPG